ncbi:Formamidopyrimidine-DNA glycosylase [Planctomycetes bacterium Pan216]|uniref:Formamidopyrimidine-DNA glycosylase n=1 Tax=Kolteria novifilia TaxID=2527975 RepID=A0A518AXM9_9BACT|nr:Formamidopyrimidine-DNA glycosylase [Planctomycetes bacterium Pan216]
MPELPEVETVVRQIRPKTLGRQILSVRKASASMADCPFGTFRKHLPGQTIERLDRHGKWMFFRLSDGNTLVIHLGMTGRLGIAHHGEPPAKHTHLRLDLGVEEELRFSDPRRFGELCLYDSSTMHERFGPHRLGPDSTTITPKAWETAIRKSRRPIKAILLDQRAVAGLGNIYVDEILFDGQVAPARLGVTITTEEAKRLHRSMRLVLGRALKHQGTSIRDYVTGQGVPGDFQRYLRVYGRANQPCKNCSAPIELTRTVVSGRATHWCPICQTMEVAPTESLSANR